MIQEDTKVCNKCGTEHPLSYFYKNITKPKGVQGECKSCWRKYDNENRMYINGKRINKDHPLWKPGRYKSLDDAWSHVEIDSRSSKGQVYIVHNAAWPDWYKVGKAVIADDRLNNYQTSSPYRDYVLKYSVDVDNRHNAEHQVHHRLKSVKHSGEWYNCDFEHIKRTIDEVRDEEASTGHRDEQQPQLDLVLCNAGR